MTWVIASASLLATWLNVRGKVASFWIWSGTNAAWAVADWRHGLPAQACLHVAYLALAVWGLRRWSRDPPAVASGA